VDEVVVKDWDSCRKPDLQSSLTQVLTPLIPYSLTPYSHSHSPRELQ
jgi:hypothetical protein